MDRKRRIILLFALGFVGVLFFGCAPTVGKTELDQHFDNNFEGLIVPDVTEIKSVGKSKSFPYTSFDNVWDSAIKVLMQEGIIVRASKNTGIIVTIAKPSFAIFVDRGEEIITVYLKHMENLDWSGGQSGVFFDKLATQLYCDEKWKYLYKTEKKN
ncbi:MAG: hypothetical protein HY761_08640 [Candidatus Omnitrophica bacterium]|nr:hypothetical protein [Candidatus Omnitrophota bacterium]